MEVSEVQTSNGLHDGLAANGATSLQAQPATFAVFNPATGEKLTDLPIYSPAEVAQAVQRSRQAQKEWEALGFKGRAEVLKRWRSKIVANKDRLIEVLVAENGKPRQEAIY